jgi:hypothetical protein
MIARLYQGGASALPALGALVLACAGACAPQPVAAPVVDRGRISCATDAECHTLDYDRVLIGIGCGPEKVTTYALEEDKMGPGWTCDTIERRRVVGQWRAQR